MSRTTRFPTSFEEGSVLGDELRANTTDVFVPLPYSQSPILVVCRERLQLPEHWEAVVFAFKATARRLKTLIGVDFGALHRSIRDRAGVHAYVEYAYVEAVTHTLLQSPAYFKREFDWALYRERPVCSIPLDEYVECEVVLGPQPSPVPVTTCVRCLAMRGLWSSYILREDNAYMLRRGL